MYSDYKNWEKLLISNQSNIKDAVEIIERNIKEKLINSLLIVDENQKLLGTLTDGDIRRGLINSSSIDTKVTTIMCDTPTFIDTKMSNANINKLIADNHTLKFFPIVNSEKVIQGLKVFEEYQPNSLQSFSNPVFIVAGGFGSRLRPLTNEVPKPMIQVGSKPILEHIISDLIEHGFKTFYISLHYKPDLIMNYFGNGSSMGVDINYLMEKEPLGTAGSLSLLPKKNINEPILMMNADLLTKVDFRTLMQFHQNRENKITVCVREHEVQVPYGVFETDGQHVLSIKEKPTFQYFVNAGIYVVSPTIIHDMQALKYIDMTTILKQEIDSGSKINLFHIFEYWRDIGGIAELEKTRMEIAGDQD